MATRAVNGIEPKLCINTDFRGHCDSTAVLMENIYTIYAAIMVKFHYMR